MALFNGRNYSKKDLLRHTGNIDQIAYIRETQITSGKGEGIKLFEVNNGGGLEFTVEESKALDILDFKYKGNNLRFLAKTGPVSAANADLKGINYTRSISGGFMYTCGLSNVGKEYIDEVADHYSHGRIRFIPSEKASGQSYWKDDEYYFKIKGETRDCGLFRDNLVLRREISTIFGEKKLIINDEVENEGFETQPLMIMYHMNLGFPLLDEGLEFFVSGKEIMPIYEQSQKEAADCMNITGPIDHYNETAYIHKLKSDVNGFAYAGVYNPKLKLGLYIKFNTDNLPNLLEWKSMMSGDYAFGIMATNNHIMGREKEIEMGTLKYIEPFEKKQFTLEINIIDSDEEFIKFKSKLKF